MNTAEKQAEVENLAGEFRGCSAAFVIGYQGTKCSQITKVRRSLKGSATLKVVKNSLARRALQGTKSEALGDMFVGPIAVLWSKDDPVAAAKLLSDFAKDVETFKLKGAVVDGQLLVEKDIAALAKMPGREELYARLLSQMNAPATRLVQVLQGSATALVRVLDAYKRKLEEGGGSSS